LQEVVVSATRRSEVQLNVPMSIAVLSADTLREAEVKSFNDFGTLVPSLSFSYGAGSAYGGNTQDRAVAIRGIQGQDTTGFYLDDLPLPISLSPRILDIQRIEVLRGPQGTLFGADSMGGTIRLITTSPDLNKFSGFLDGQASSVDGGGNGYQIYGTLNAPIVDDKLALRITPFVGQDGGYINRLWPITPPDSAATPSTVPPGPYSEQKNTAQNEYYGVDASLLWKPTSNLTIRPRSIYQHSSVNGLPLGNYSADNLNNVFHFDVPEGTTDRFWINGVTIDFETGVGTITNAFDVMDRHTGDNENLTEFTAFVLGTPMAPAPVSQFDETHIVNEELRFVSGWQSPLQLTAGFFYNRQSYHLEFTQPVPEALSPVLAPSTVIAANYYERFQDERALFGELSYQFTPQWSATLGGRYSKDSSSSNTWAWGAAFPPAQTLEEAVPFATSEHDSVFTPKVVLRYQPSGNLTVYADAAKGFRPGNGQLPPPLDLCGDALASLGLTQEQLSTYKPDSVWSYELGAKALTVDHRYQLNAAIYWINWDNFRAQLPLPCGFAAVVNAGKAVSRGVELDFSAVPMTNLTLEGGFGYDNAEIRDAGSLVLSPPVWWQIPGSKLTGVAPITAHFSAAYRIPLTGGRGLELRADYSFTDQSLTATTNPYEPYVRPSYSLLGFRTAFTTGNAQFALFVRNALDQHPNYGEQYSIGGFVPDRLRWSTGVPRTYGLEISHTF
jgi:outer membrane receptor protein involved in Fe transport